MKIFRNISEMLLIIVAFVGFFLMLGGKLAAGLILFLISAGYFLAID